MMAYRQAAQITETNSVENNQTTTEPEKNNQQQTAVSHHTPLSSHPNEQGNNLAQMTNGRLSRASHTLLQLQSQYGNQYVQRVVNQAQTIQRKELGDQDTIQHQPSSPNNTGLPDQLKHNLEQISGFDMSDVRVHSNSPKPIEVGAAAYTQGSDIYLDSGQEKHLPHEAWHVIQQKQGRVQPTIQAKGMSINDDAGLEHEADVIGKQAMHISDTAVSGPNAQSTTGGLENETPAKIEVIQRKIYRGPKFSVKGIVSPKEALEILLSSGIPQHTANALVKYYGDKNLENISLADLIRTAKISVLQDAENEEDVGAHELDEQEAFEWKETEMVMPGSSQAKIPRDANRNQPIEKWSPPPVSKESGGSKAEIYSDITKSNFVLKPPDYKKKGDETSFQFNYTFDGMLKQATVGYGSLKHWEKPWLDLHSLGWRVGALTALQQEAPKHVTDPRTLLDILRARAELERSIDEEKKSANTANLVNETKLDKGDDSSAPYDVDAHIDAMQNMATRGQMYGKTFQSRRQKKLWTKGGKDPQSLNCWEGVLYAALQAGLIDKKYMLLADKEVDRGGGYADNVLSMTIAKHSGKNQLKLFAKALGGNLSTGMQENVFSRLKEVNIPKGYIIVFGKAGEHVALSTGKKMKPILLNDPFFNKQYISPTFDQGHGMIEIEDKNSKTYKIQSDVMEKTVEDVMLQYAVSVEGIYWGLLPSYEQLDNVYQDLKKQKAIREKEAKLAPYREEYPGVSDEDLEKFIDWYFGDSEEAQFFRNFDEEYRFYVGDETEKANITREREQRARREKKKNKEAEKTKKTNSKKPKKKSKQKTPPTASPSPKLETDTKPSSSSAEEQKKIREQEYWKGKNAMEDYLNRFVRDDEK